MTEKTWLFITRAQPGLHTGHLDGIKQAVEQGITNLVIGVWSANKEFTSDNPFTYEERKQMIHLCKSALIDVTKVIVGPIPDFEDNNSSWLNYIMTQFPHFEYVITGNPWVQGIFKETDKKIIPLEIREVVKSSTLRSHIAMGNVDDLSTYLPQEVVDYLSSINAVQRMKDIFKLERKTPSLVVDVVFLDQEGNLILIDRKNFPKGLALPGGFVDYGESPEQAVIRETKEETGADISVQDLIGVFGEAERDPRHHNVSVAYKGIYTWWDIVAWDDAKAIIKVKPEDIETMVFAFPDHKEIIKKGLFAKHDGLVL